MVHHRWYAIRSEAEADICEYIEIFYNRQRIQQKLEYSSPVAFARKYLAEKRMIEKFGFQN